MINKTIFFCFWHVCRAPFLFFGGTILVGLVLLAVTSATGAGVSTEDLFNPAPAQGDFILPMPNNARMVFRPVFIGEGSDPFALRKFKVGDPDSGFKEYPTTVALGGSFVGEKDGGSDWLYYMGKYEVTKAQYAAVMGTSDVNPEALSGKQYPMAGISYFQALQFIDRYNQWLFANAINSLPRNETAVGYVRLPSEIEWEFAVRGGATVSPDDFDRRLPYEENLSKCEWFSGPSSSHNKVKPVGLLLPNSLKIHDMLGNVTEITGSLYQIEYYQGRSGGFVARGGHYLTAGKKLRSALRTEEPFYMGTFEKGFKPNQKPTMGLRLVLASIIYADRNTTSRLDDAWEAYRKGKGAGLPAAVSISPTSAQTGVKKEDAFIHFDRIKKEIQQGKNISEGLRQELGLLEAALGDIEFIRKQADEDAAYAWGKIAAERGFFIFREIRKLPTLDRLLDIARKTGRSKMVESYTQRREELVQNIDNALTTYSDSFRQLSSISTEAVEKGFERYVAFLLEHKAVEQVRVLNTVREHYSFFNRDKRANKEKWRGDFTKISNL